MFRHLWDWATKILPVTFEETFCNITWVFRFDLRDSPWLHDFGVLVSCPKTKKLFSLVDECAVCTCVCILFMHGCGTSPHWCFLVDTERDRQKYQVKRIFFMSVSCGALEIRTCWADSTFRRNIQEASLVMQRAQSYEMFFLGKTGKALKRLKGSCFPLFSLRRNKVKQFGGFEWIYFL
jgi:hypothetical protein